MDLLIAAIPAGTTRNRAPARESGLGWPVGPPPPPGSVPAGCANGGGPPHLDPGANLIRGAKIDEGHTTFVICLTCALAAGLFGASPTHADGQDPQHRG
ncbi:MAG TPA: hypothetical protein VF933_16400 [Streptosporangiaceae bacterium]